MLQPKANLSLNRSIVQDFRKAVDFCTLPHVPKATRELIATGAWRDRLEGIRRIRFEHLSDFITGDKGKGGCGWQPDNVTELLRKSGDDEALQIWLTALQSKRAREQNAADLENKRPAHRPAKSESVYDEKKDVHTSARPSGNSAAAAHRRLREHRPEIHARVLSGEITANAGMVEAGFRTPRASRKKSVLDHLRHWWGKASEEERRTFRDEI
jgi:hypothetical protein